MKRINPWAELPSITRNARVKPVKRQLARQFRKQMTASERLAWELLRNRRMLGLKFRRQQVIRGYVVDFYCAELRVALEIDGAVHDGFEQAFRDVGRDLELMEFGVITFRLPAEEVSANNLRKLLEPIARRARQEPKIGPEVKPGRNEDDHDRRDSVAESGSPRTSSGASADEADRAATPARRSSTRSS